jgi:elongator complex protein 3
MRELGCTRVELGVQNTSDKILKLIKRGHDTQEIKRATKMLKDYGFKVDYHLMPQLPGAAPTTDLKMMLKVFDDPDYRPDMIKIYPCTVVKTSELYDWLERGEYKTYSDRHLINMLKKFKARVPRYVRISRLIRDIPGHHIQAGNKMTNLRQVIQAEMKKEGLKCNCLRCREVGHQHFADGTTHKPKLFIDEYEASGGKEYFLSFEDAKRDVVYAFCRLRVLSEQKTSDKIILPKGLPNEGITPAVLDTMGYPAFIRELHTYGQLINIGKKSDGASQHIGLGTKLIAEAEKICQKNKSFKLAVISGVGVRGYYKKFGYKLENTYMVKSLKK